MKKKVYQKPTMELIEADMGQQILQMVSPVNQVKTKGLFEDDEEDLNYESTSGNPWEKAW